MGRLFSKAARTLVPSGTIDLLPTLLHVLDYPIPPTVEGRILYEALAQPQGVSGSIAASHTYSADTVTAAGLYRQHLTTTTDWHDGLSGAWLGRVTQVAPSPMGRGDRRLRPKRAFETALDMGFLEFNAVWLRGDRLTSPRRARPRAQPESLRLRRRAGT